MISKNTHKIHLKDLFWDYHFNEDELQALLNGDVDKVGHLDRNALYARILTSMNWYQIMDLIPGEKIKEALSDEVIERIRFKDLREKYYFAKRLLFK